MPVGKKKFKIGIVLSGGAVRGFAHVGVLKALNEHGIFPDIISGASAGSIAGSLYADGKTPDEILRIFEKKSIYKFLEFIVPNKGLVKMTGMHTALKQSLTAKTFEELKIPFFAAVTDLNNAKSIYFNSGDLPTMVIASSTIPILFTPVIIDGVYYVDGGVINNLPIEPIEHLCEKIIGVNVNHVGYKKTFSGMMEMADRAIHMMIDQNMEHKKEKFDLYIEPEELNNVGLMEMANHLKIYEIGYKETNKILKEKNPFE
jgi:NTE family protein